MATPRSSISTRSTYERASRQPPTPPPLEARNAPLSSIIQPDDGPLFTRIFGLASIAVAIFRLWTQDAQPSTRAVTVLLLLGGFWLVLVRKNAEAPIDWSKEIVLITGGGSGLGAVLAQKIINDPKRQGVKVVVLTNVPPERFDSRIATYNCDVSSKADVELVADIVRFEVGAPTILINNAGVVNGKLILDLTEDDVRRSFDVNALAHYWTIQAFLPDMLDKRHGHIVNVASVLGLCGFAQCADYCASKAAVISLHASLRSELDLHYTTPEIRTTTVCPGHIQTAMFSRIYVPDRLLLKPLTLSLSPEAVADAISDSLNGSRRDSILRLPFYTHSARLLGPGPSLVPAPLRRAIEWFTAANFAMFNFGPKPSYADRLRAWRTETRARRGFVDPFAHTSRT
ncbi:Short-chain dehydrogenase/reductase family 16C member 6 [Vanrija pseudolonga]|uniref:Short-chain dehydrogenase/reductase 3 n=1 Tax=Vanrija pseudolonga TaxID=143232 RepID=A0AAF0Y604_9TREE|nr:Short-chain dehydrogenase/reductase family 16C member 6 [Vanrija pseudolonga]